MTEVFSWEFSSAFAVLESKNEFENELLDKTKERPGLEGWERPTLEETYEVRGKPAPLGDFPGTTGFMHVLSPLANVTVGPLFAKYGTLYPVYVKGWDAEGFLFQPRTTAACLNLEQSKVIRIPWNPKQIASVIDPVFVADKIPNSGIFVLEECPTGRIYVCGDVVDEVRKCKLAGFEVVKVHPR